MKVSIRPIQLRGQAQVFGQLENPPTHPANGGISTAGARRKRKSNSWSCSRTPPDARGSRSTRTSGRNLSWSGTRPASLESPCGRRWSFIVRIARAARTWRGGGVREIHAGTGAGVDFRQNETRIGVQRRQFIEPHRLMPLRSLNREHALAWLQNDEWGPSTFNTYLTSLNTFFRWCVKVEYLEKSPTASIEKIDESRMPDLDEPPVVLSVAQAEQLLRATLRVDAGTHSLCGRGFVRGIATGTRGRKNRSHRCPGADCSRAWSARQRPAAAGRGNPSDAGGVAGVGRRYAAAQSAPPLRARPRGRRIDFGLSAKRSAENGGRKSFTPAGRRIASATPSPATICPFSARKKPSPNSATAITKCCSATTATL